MEKTAKVKKTASIGMDIIGIILCVVFIPMLFFNLTFIIGGFFKSDIVPHYLGYRFIIENTTAMEAGNHPIYKGDFVIMKADVNNIVVGDEVTVLINNQLFIRKVQKIEEEGGTKIYILTANNQDGSQSVLPEQVLGAYVGRIRYLGAVMLFLQTTWGVILLIGGPALIFVIFDLTRELKSKRNIKEPLVEEINDEETTGDVLKTVKVISAKYYPREYSPKMVRRKYRLEEGVVVADLIMDEQPDGSQKISFSRRTPQKTTNQVKIKNIFGGSKQ